MDGPPKLSMQMLDFVSKVKTTFLLCVLNKCKDALIQRFLKEHPSQYSKFCQLHKDKKGTKQEAG